MFVLPAIVSSIALREATDVFAGHWPDQAPTGDAPPRRARQGSRLTQTLTLFVVRLSR